MDKRDTPNARSSRSVCSPASLDASISGVRKPTGAEMVERGNARRSDSKPRRPRTGNSALNHTRSSSIPMSSMSSNAACSVGPLSFRSSFTDRPSSMSARMAFVRREESLLPAPRRFLEPVMPEHESSDRIPANIDLCPSDIGAEESIEVRTDRSLHAIRTPPGWAAPCSGMRERESVAPAGHRPVLLETLRPEDRVGVQEEDLLFRVGERHRP